jgi:hypothetical protein
MRVLDETEKKIVAAIASAYPVAYKDVELVYRRVGSYDATDGILRTAVAKGLTLFEALTILEMMNDSRAKYTLSSEEA